MTQQIASVVKSDLWPHFDADGAISHVCWRLRKLDTQEDAEGRAQTILGAYLAIQEQIDLWFPPDTVDGRAIVVRKIIDGAEHDEIH